MSSLLTSARRFQIRRSQCISMDYLHFFRFSSLLLYRRVHRVFPGFFDHFRCWLGFELGFLGCPVGQRNSSTRIGQMRMAAFVVYARTKSVK